MDSASVVQLPEFPTFQRPRGGLRQKWSLHHITRRPRTGYRVYRLLPHLAKLNLREQISPIRVRLTTWQGFQLKDSLIVLWRAKCHIALPEVDIASKYSASEDERGKYRLTVICVFMISQRMFLCFCCFCVAVNDASQFVWCLLGNPARRQTPAPSQSTCNMLITFMYACSAALIVAFSRDAHGLIRLRMPRNLQREAPSKQANTR